jgi:hypothetical protein
VRIARADSAFVNAAPDGDSDLFLALRGGGNSFGVATNPHTYLFLAWGNGPESELDFARELLTGPGGVPTIDGSFSVLDDAIRPMLPERVAGPRVVPRAGRP